MHNIKIAKELLKIAKQIVAFIGVNSYNDGSYSVVSGRWPRLYFNKISDSLFEVFTIRSPAAIDKLITPEIIAECSKDAKRNIVDAESAAEYIKHDIKFYTSYAITNLMRHLGEKPWMWNLAIEKKETLNSLNEVYNYMLIKGKVHPQSAQKILGIQPTQEDFIQIDSWKVKIYPEVRKEKDYIENLLKEVEFYLKAKGFGNLAHGEIHLVGQLGGSRMADYENTSDILRLAANKRFDKSIFIRNILHELGHRNWYKFLSSTSRRNVTLKYYDKVHSKAKLELTKGDIISSDDGTKKFEVIEENYADVSVKLVETTSKRMQPNIGSKYRIDKRVIEHVYKIEKGSSTTFGKSDFRLWFPSAYSSRDDVEFYAELFADYLMKGLPQPVQEWFSNL